MQNIEVHRYADPVALEDGDHPKGHEYAGYVEPQDHSWIVYVRDDGGVEAYLNRDPATGAIL